MTDDPRFTPLAASLPATVPFVGPEAQERASGRLFAARLGANENLFGPSPAAIAAMQAEAVDVWKYPDPEAHDLRRAISAHHGVSPENIMLGEGIDGLLGVAVRLLLAPGEVAVTSAGAYPTFNYHVAGFGGRIEAVPYIDDHEDPEALIARAGAVGAKLIYIANPDNPMGTWHDADRIQRMIEAVPDGAILLLDEAYIELAPEGTAPQIAPDDPRVLRFRTFSKAYGMAGARVGYVIGAAKIIAGFDRIRNHFGLNRVAQAGALAAISDQIWLDHVRKEVAESRIRIGEIGRQNGLIPVPSATNFVALDCSATSVQIWTILNALISKGIFVRMPFVAPQDRCIRISCGRASDLDAFAAALPDAIAMAQEHAQQKTRE